MGNSNYRRWYTKSEKEFIEFKNWWWDNREKMIEDLGNPIQLLPPSAECVTFYLRERGDVALFTSNVEEERWLVKNCPLEFVKHSIISNN